MQLRTRLLSGLLAAAAVVSMPLAADASEPEAFFPTLRITDVTITEADGGTRIAAITVTLPTRPAAGAAVTFATRNGTATAPQDYFSQPPTVLLFNGLQSVTISVLTKGDTIAEEHETLEVVFSNPVKVRLTDQVGLITMTDNDRRTVRLEPGEQIEPDADTRNMPFTIRLDASPLGNETVRIRTVNGSATAGSDFVAVDQVVSLTGGGPIRFVQVPIIGDLAVEGTETFTLEIVSVTNLTIATPANVLGTITDNDTGGGGGLRITSISNPTIVEANSGTKAMNFIVALSGPATGTESFKISTANGTATAGSDYVARTNATITIPAGNTQRSVTVTINGDTLDEPNETLLLNIVSAIGLTIDDNQATGTITDND